MTNSAHTIEIARTKELRTSRRSLVKGILTSAVAGTSGVTASAETEMTFDLQHWLDVSDPIAVADYHGGRLARAMERLDPTRVYRFHINSDKGFALVVGDPVKDHKAPIARVYMDDGEPLLAADVTGPRTYPPRNPRA